MNFRLSSCLLLSVFAFQAAMAPTADAQNRTHRRRGALLGGLAGAALGVAIGDKGNNETAGALIGGAVGAIAGGAIGNAKDQRIEHDHQYHSPAHQPHHSGQGHSGHGYSEHGYQGHGYPGYGHYDHSYHGQQVLPYHSYSVDPGHIVTPLYPQPIMNSPQSLSTHDVVAMVQGGLSEVMVIRQIRLHGMRNPLSISEIISLHQQGISDPILQSMQGR